MAIIKEPEFTVAWAVEWLNLRRQRLHEPDCSVHRPSAQCSCGLHRVISIVRDADGGGQLASLMGGPPLTRAESEASALRSALTALEQAYSNPHSPQHRAACLAEARAVLHAASVEAVNFKRHRGEAMKEIRVCAGCRRPVPNDAERLECPECVHRPRGVAWKIAIGDEAERYYSRDVPSQITEEEK